MANLIWFWGYTDNYGLIDTKDTNSIKLNLIEQRCVLPDIIRNKESDKTKLWTHNPQH